MKTNTEIAIECGAIVHADGNIFLTNETKLKAIIDAVNARDGEPVLASIFDEKNEHIYSVCCKAFNDKDIAWDMAQEHINDAVADGEEGSSKWKVKFTFTSPQPNQSAYIKRLEDALKDIRRYTAGLYQETDSKSLMNRLIDVRGRADTALANKESIDG